jgi:hypothetical protein
MTDFTLGHDDPARGSYLNDRAFRGLFLRQEYQSLAEFIEEAIEFYKPFGGKDVGDPVQIDFPSGARIYFNHLQDEKAYTKYKGWNLTFIGIEELTTIPSLQQYRKLLGSLRATPRVREVAGPNGTKVQKTFPPLRTQMAATTNPDGPGAPWVMDRFVYVPDEKGKDIPWGTPMYDGITGSWRCFIPFPIEGNPYLADSTTAGRRYMGMLRSQDEVTQRQWIHGDWRAGSSVFFTEYRPDGPNPEEIVDFPWANHRTDPVLLRPWWYRFGSGDWAYDHPAAFHKFCRNEQDKRLHIYDEMQVRRVAPFELGALLAKWWLPELSGLHKHSKDAAVVLHIGSDMFRKTSDERTIAEQMAAGIREVLGSYGAVLMKMDDVEREINARDPRRARDVFQRRMKEAEGKMRLVLKPCWPDRVSAWQFIRDMLRWRPAMLQFHTNEERGKYLRQVLAEEGRESYELQAANLQKAKPEILPKLQIWRCCAELDRCLRTARRVPSPNDPSKVDRSDDVLKFNADSEGKGGDDSLESFRNGCFAYKEIQTSMPLDVYVSERIEEIQEEYEKNYGERLTDPARLAMIAQTQVANFAKQQGPKAASFSLPSKWNIRHRPQ